MNRRDLFKVAPAAIAGAATLPAQHAGHTQTVKTIEAAWKPLLFDDHQNKTVLAIAELVIPATDTPGAREAKVNEYIDLILHDGPAEWRNRFLQGLGWVDGYAIRTHQKPFVSCTGEQQVAILKALDAGSDAALKPGSDFFRGMKRLTAQAYYSTEIGVKELNKGGRVPASFGCKQGDH